MIKLLNIRKSELAGVSNNIFNTVYTPTTKKTGSSGGIDYVFGEYFAISV